VRQWRQRNKEQTDKVEIETSLKELTEAKDKNSGDNSQEKSDEEKNTEVDDKEDGEKMDTDSSENTNNNNARDGVKEDSGVKQSDDVIDDTDCKFNVNSFKLVYVVNSESYLYKRMALQRAREVNLIFLLDWRHINILAVI
jgi:hypothetical protein